MGAITKLADDECFVFGSNEGGFHGAGAAGLACRGDAANTWRSDQWFLKAIDSPEGSWERIGKWAIYGQAEGFQRGKEGCSYAVITVTKPGRRRSIPLEQIQKSLEKLWVYAAKVRPDLKFLMTRLGEGYAGYTHEEMNGVYRAVLEKHGCLMNIVFLDGVPSGEVVQWS